MTKLEFSVHLSGAVEFDPDENYGGAHRISLPLNALHKWFYYEALSSAAKDYDSIARRNKAICSSAESSLDFEQVQGFRDEALLESFRKSGVSDLYMTEPDVIDAASDLKHGVYKRLDLGDIPDVNFGEDAVAR